MKQKKYDLLVIGTGSAASAAAYKCRSAGMSVAVVDKQPFGGTCANRGCDPKKMLYGAAELLDWSRRMNDKGFEAAGSRIHWPRLMAFKNSFTAPVPQNREKRFQKAGIAIYHGTAVFNSPQSVLIGDTEITATHIHIAAGARPARLNIPGEEHLTHSDRFLEMDKMPGKIIFVGGGYISMEFAHIASRAGAMVTILHRGTRPLERFDAEMVTLLGRATEEAGIEIRLSSTVREISKSGNQLRVSATEGGVNKIFTADLVVHGAGRVPSIGDMNPEAANIAWDKRGVQVNQYLQSVSNPAVYAAGDVAATDGPPLTPVAGSEGLVAAANIINGPHKTVNYRGTPSVAFTIPQIAKVGLMEEEAREKGLSFTVKSGETGGWFSSVRVAEKYSGFKTLVDRESGKIIGAHLLGHNAAEVINLFAMAIRFSIPAGELKRMMYAYPTNGSDIPYMV